ncbi:MAG: hypothetical protein JWP97_3862 [Labilithrix sp.]|nr:hypothetical protein [Labilithrix sp.]
MRLEVLVPVVGLLACFATDARAQGGAAPGSDLDRARALYVEAGELEQKGQWGPAEERLRSAIRIRETPNLRYALAWAVENQDHLVEARTEYELALRLAQRSQNDEVSRLAMQRLTEVDRNTPLLQVRVKGTARSDMRVLVDGREVPIRGDAGTAPVDPGSHLVRVETGAGSKEETVVFARGGLRVVEVEGGGAAGISLGGSADTPEPKRSSVPWVFLGGGAALVATSAVLFGASAGDASKRDEKQAQWCTETACAGSTATLPETTAATTYRREATDAASRGNTKQAIGAVVGGVGVVGLGVGVYLLVTRDGKEAKEPPRSARAARVSFDAFDAAPLPGGGHAAASFTF